MSSRLAAMSRSPVIVPIVLLALVVSIQAIAGSYESERGLFSDESAHFLNGLLLRDYIHGGLGQNPMTFAREYYAHYPKIAPLVWPPLFHVILGLFLLPGWPPAVAAVFLLALFSSWTAWRLYTIVSTLAAPPIAVAAAVYFVTRPLIVQLSSVVMVDLVIAAFALEAAYWLARFFSTGKDRHAVAFGCFTAAACLTKGNGIAAVLMPVFVIGLTGRYDVLKARGLYLAAGIVAVCAAPLLALAFYLDPSPGDFSVPTSALVWERILFYSRALVTAAGPVPVGLALIGAAATLWKGAWPSPAGRTLARASFALVAGGFAFHLLSPHVLSEERYMALALAPTIALSAAGLTVIAQAASSRALRVGIQCAALVLVAVPAFTQGVRHLAAAPLGYRNIVRHLADQNRLSSRSLLVVSNEQGEGACVAEVAVLGLMPAPTVLRGSKLFASDDWMGRRFKLRYASADDVLADLEAMHVDYIVVDSSPETMKLPYWAQTLDLVERHPDRVELVLRQPARSPDGPTRPLALYQLKVRPPGPPAPFLPQARGGLF